MSGVRRWRLAIVLTIATATLLACNAIVGVVDVVAREGDAGGKRPRNDGDPNDPDTPGPGGQDDDAAVRADKELALGFLHGCGRLSSGAVRCWGYNSDGQLGDGIPLDAGNHAFQSNKALLVPGLAKVTSIAAGNSHTCVVSEGAVLCWGQNTWGQLGNGNTGSSSKPVAVAGLTNATAVAGGVNFTCALRSDKTVVCWGENASGQLGDGTTTDHFTPQPVKQLTDAVSIAAGYDHACAVLTSGGVMCWGKNGTGQLGIGSTSESLTPTKLIALEDIAQVAGASEFSCARKRSGQVYCWGSNSDGQLGNGSPNASPNPSPIIVPSISDATFVWTGSKHACAVRNNGAVVCWGHAQDGQLGVGYAPDAAIASPTPVVNLSSTPVIGVWTGGNRSCALRSDERVFCWGSNALGQLGNGSTDGATSPTPVIDYP